MICVPKEASDINISKGTRTYWVSMPVYLHTFAVISLTSICKSTRLYKLFYGYACLHENIQALILEFKCLGILSVFNSV